MVIQPWLLRSISILVGSIDGRVIVRLAGVLRQRGLGLLAKLIVTGVISGLMAATAQAQDRSFHFNISDQSLSQALRNYGHICGQEVIFTEEIVAGLNTTSLKGDYTAQGALARLLQGTGLIAERSPSGALMIRRQYYRQIATDTPAPLSLERTAYAGALILAQTEPAAPERTAAQNSASSPSVERADSASDNGGRRDPVEQVVVTGSRISRRDYNSDSPIVTVDQGAISATGQVTVDRALGQMPQFAAAQGLTEVGDVQAGTGFGGGQAYSDLRGLGPNRALVLLDGRRMQPGNPNGSIDLNTIPMALIDNVEVITGGASAAYGSDAMAGVVNFKLRRKFQGLEFDVQHGATTHGDAGNNLVSALVGGDFNEGRGNGVIALEYSERDLVPGKDRVFFSNVRGFGFPQEGILQPSGSNPPTIAAVNGVLATYPGTTPIPGTGIYPGATGVNTDGTIFTDKYSRSPVQNYRGNGPPLVQIGANGTQVNTMLAQFFALQVPLQKYNVFSRGNYKLNDDVSAFAQMNFSHYTARDETSPANATSSGKFITIPANNPFISADLRTILNSRPNPTAPLVYAKQLVELGNRVETYNYDVFQAVFGFKGDVPGRDLTWEIYGSGGRDVFDNVQYNDGSKAAYAAMLNGTANYTSQSGSKCIGYGNYNPFGLNGMSPGCLEFAQRNNHNTNTIDQRNLEASAQGKLATLPAGDLRFALGADYRSDRFDYVPDSQLVIGDGFAYGTASPTGGSSNVREVFGELLVPVLANRPLIQDLSLDLGYRYSRYARFGGVNTYNADLNWQPVSSLRLRGGYQRAIRAPSLGELFAPQTAGTLPTGDPPSPTKHLATGDPCDVNGAYRNGPNAAQVIALCQAQGVPAALIPTYTYGSTVVTGVQGGNPDLTQETADTYSIGAVWRPQFDSPLLQNFDISIDYFNIKISQAVGSISLSNILQRCFNIDGISNPTYTTANVYCTLLTRDPQTGNIAQGRQLLLNLATYKTDGVDLQLDWSFGLGAVGLSDGAGKIRLNSMVSYTKSFDVASLPGSPVLNYAGSIGNDSVSPDVAHPHWKAVTALGYGLGPFSAGVHWRYIGAMVHQSSVADPTSIIAGVPAYNYFDLDLHYNYKESLEFSAGATNLADKGPPVVSGTPLNTDPATYDIIGRAYYLSLKAKF
jgi:outer membrane receptor protein involved in Fe transport